MTPSGSGTCRGCGAAVLWTGPVANRTTIYDPDPIAVVPSQFGSTTILRPDGRRVRGHALQLHTELRIDGTWSAEIVGLPGALASGGSKEEAARALKGQVLRTLAERIEQGEREVVALGYRLHWATCPARKKLQLVQRDGRDVN